MLDELGKGLMRLDSLADRNQGLDVLQLDRQKLNEQIAERIQGQITDGKLRPGDRLPPERELASMLKVNRATVREAIDLLRERGLVERKNGRGTRIVAVLPDFVGAAIDRCFSTNNCSQRELWDFRHIFEPKVAALAAANARPEEIKKLAAVLRDLEAAWEDRDSERLATVDAQFHLVLAEASHNTLILAVAMGLNIVLQRFMRNTHASTHSEESFRTHRAIYRAVLTQDVEIAERQMRAQMESTPISDRDCGPLNP